MDRTRRRHFLLFQILVTVLVASWTGVAAQDDDDAAANRLIVEAMMLIDRAEAQVNPVLRLSHLRDAQANLDRIIEDLPGTDLAVRLALREGLGRLDPDALARQIDELLPEACATAPDGGCILLLAEQRVDEIDTPTDRADALRRIALAWSMLDEAVRAREAIGLALNSALVATDPEARRVSRELVEVSRATVLARAGLVDDAMQLARAVGEPGSQAQIVAAAAVIQAEAGDRTGAAQSAAIARSLLDAIPQQSLRDSTLHAIARAQAAIGDVPTALTAVDQIAGAYAQALTGCWIAYYTAEAAASDANPDAAAEAAADSTDPPADIEPLLDASHRIADTLADWRDRASLLACFAAVHARTGDAAAMQALIAEGLDLAARAGNPYQQALAQALMVRPLRLAGDYETAGGLSGSAIRSVWAIRMVQIYLSDLRIHTIY